MTDGTGLYERNQKALSKMSFLRFFPLVVTGGEGAWLSWSERRRLIAEGMFSEDVLDAGRSRLNTLDQVAAVV